MSYSMLEKWIDYTSVIEFMRVPKYHRQRLNEFCNITVHEANTDEERAVMDSISLLYDGLCIFFRDDSGISQFMNEKQPSLNGRTPWDVLVTSQNHLPKRCDLVLVLASKLHTPYHEKKRF